MRRATSCTSVRSKFLRWTLVVVAAFHNVRQVAGKRKDLGLVGVGQLDVPISSRAAVRLLQLFELAQPSLPVRFERSSDHALVGVDRLVPSLGELCFVARTFQALGAADEALATVVSRTTVGIWLIAYYGRRCA